MSTKLTFNWAGKTDAEDGEAMYTVGDTKLLLPLPNFSVAYDLSELLGKAYQGGIEDGTTKLSQLIYSTLDNATRCYRED